jgi:hypothetical protein
MSRHEEKSFSNMDPSSEKIDTTLEDLARNVPGWAHQGGAYDTSDIVYMRSQLEIKKQEEDMQQKILDGELSLFRLKAMQAQSRADTISLPVREKRPSKTAVQVKIKAKKRRVNNNAETDGKSQDSDVKEVQQQVTGTSEEEKFDETPLGDALGMLLAVYSDSD